MRRNPHILGRIRWAALAVAVSFAGLLFVMTSGAQAVVVNDNGTVAGVAMVPGTVATLPSGMVQTATGCTDPALQFTPDLAYASGTTPLCWRGGTVMHANETFALTWDPYREYWAGTRGYVEQYLRNVADGSGTFTSPFSITSQYTDSQTLQAGSSFLVNSRAQNTSKYGGGCIDYGSTGGSDCQIGTGTTQGSDYPGAAKMGSCYVSGSNPCLTDGDIRGEVTRIAAATNLTANAQAGYTPLVVVLTPPAAVVCLDSSGTLCSANGSSTAQFCSYHSQVNGIDYVVQPWTTYTGCDEPNLPKLPANPSPAQLATDAGTRLVGPLSESQIAAVVNPGLNGWAAQSGAEIDDNGGCLPAGPTGDGVTVGSGSYVLQREYNNAGAMELDPNTYFGCAPNAFLSPTFVVPSAVNAGDVVVFDGSATASTLIVPNAGYVWNFGDGTSAVGPSVVHSYTKGGSFTVTLTVTDRGGNTQTMTQPITVLGPNGLPVPPSNPPTSNPTNTGSNGALQVRMQLLPQGLRAVLRAGIKVQVFANGPANGIASVYVSRAMAKRAHIKAGQGAVVVLGRGTVSQIKDGTVVLHLFLARRTALKLKHLKHATLNVRLALVGVGGDHLVVVAAGRY